jgi:hypothetical protein
METYKVGIKSYSSIEYNCETRSIRGEYWTTVKAENERQAKLLARENLAKKIAMGEIFTWYNIRLWKRIYIDLSDMVIGQ